MQTSSYMKGVFIMSRKKKRAGSIAVPYLVTIFIGILIIGGGTFILLKHLGVLGNSKELVEPTPRQVDITSYADNHSILMILEEPDLRCSSTFMLIRSIPKDKKLVFVGIPTNTIAVINDVQQSIGSAYDKGGAASALEFAETVFDVEIDRYMVFNSKALIKAGDIIGGVEYPISPDIAGFNGDGSEQYLNSEQIEKLITYALYSDGEIERAYVVSSVASAMINQADGLRIADNLDSSFNTIINMIDTNITAVDYKKHKAAIKNMFSRGSGIASFVILEGDSAYDEYIPDAEFIEKFKRTYYKYDESDKNTKDSE